MSSQPQDDDDEDRKPAAASSSSMKKGTSNPQKNRTIAVLPQQVVDQIAAGEVVQRPASVVKELLENCLDAGSTHIVIHVEKGGLSKLTVTDNGCGISKADLTLAATRHATSKLSDVEDFASLDTFGFRGEALSSMSMVSRLTVTSRTADSAVGYIQQYRNGSPTTTTPKPCARKPGTTILIQDLFYNVPHRQKTYAKRESDEYSRILNVVQSYAMHYPHAGFVCQRTRNKIVLVDLNTSQLPHVKALVDQNNTATNSNNNDDGDDDDENAKEEAIAVKATKQIISHVFESNLESHLSYLECSASGKQPGDFTYEASVYYSSPNYDAKTSTGTSKLVLFLNHRLVDLPALKRTLEDVYSDHNSTAKPIVVVSITVPGTQVDVNVHPSKRQVALVYQEELCSAIRTRVQDALQALGQAFQSQSVVPKVKNPYARKRKGTNDENDDNNPSPKPASSAKRKTPPSQLIRTSGATPVGAIEPFLVSTQPSPPPSQGTPTQATQQPSSTPQSPTSDTPPSSQDGTHTNDCPLSTPIDLSQPGAFALRCTCAPTTTSAVLLKKPVVRPKRVIPTKCSYASVASLRKRATKQSSADLSKQLKDAYFVGVVSHQRSLIQCGEGLMMINHLELAKDLFYQLALARFGGVPMAQLGCGGVNVQTVIAHALQLEDDLILLEHSETTLSQEPVVVNATNENLAQQATACLLDNAGMLEEYFGVRIEEQQQEDDVISVVLTGLPVLLDGHAPEPHGLAIFLLRLATQVDWSEERLCFQRICQELGDYYAQLPSSDDDEAMRAYVQHTLFPAISYLLLPSERFQSDGSYTVMTKLSTLYKVFERC